MSLSFSGKCDAATLTIALRGAGRDSDIERYHPKLIMKLTRKPGENK